MNGKFKKFIVPFIRTLQCKRRKGDSYERLLQSLSISDTGLHRRDPPLSPVESVQPLQIVSTVPRTDEEDTIETLQVNP